MYQNHQCGSQTSLPTRERGLKSDHTQPNQPATASLPTRERGLKLPFIYELDSRKEVAPYTGAWIEI